MSFLKQHYLVCIIVCAVGIMSVAPELYAVALAGNGFHGIFPMNIDDEEYYLARHQEVLDGHIHLGNPYLFEHKDAGGTEFWIPDYVVAKGTKLLGLGTGTGEFFLDLILPFLLALLTYALLFSVTGDRWVSAAGTILLHLGLFLFVFGRVPSPQFNFIFWLSLFILLVQLVRTQKWRWSVLAGINLGLLFYIYTYYWTYFVILIGVFATLSLFVFREWVHAKRVALTLGIAGIVAVPYFLTTLKNLNNPVYKESMLRLGLLTTHFPSGIAIVALSGTALVLFVACVWKKYIPRDPLSLFLGSALLSSIIAVNQHVITGKNLEFSSHYWLLAIFAVVVATAYGAAHVRTRVPSRFQEIFGGALVVVALLVSIPHVHWTVQRQAYMDADEYSWQRYHPVLDWLNKNTDKDSVVLTGPTLSWLIPIYTSDDVFYYKLANLHVLSNAEVTDRFILNNYGSMFDEHFARVNERAIWNSQFINAYSHNQSKNKVRWLFRLPPVQYETIPQRAMNVFLSRARTLSSTSLRTALAPYRLDYVIVDRGDAAWHFDARILSLGKPVYDRYGLTIYRVTR